ncbi:MAG: hypothetical protein ABSF88_13115 [Candidatus Aminicenantales bacterium]|jgi:hypothetical protein
MKELFSLLSMAERRTASILGAVLGAAACLFLLAAVREHRGALRSAEDLRSMDINYETLSRSRTDVKKERQAWADAEKDMVTLKASRFYDGRTVVRNLRLDLQRIFDAAGIAVSDINYGYQEIVKDSLQKVTVDFRFSGNYSMLKRLLDLIERHPRFLHADKIDFLSIGKQPGLLDLKIGLAGYYEN